MINNVFQSVHEAVKKRNNPEDFLPQNSSKDIIHRGYLKKSSYPIKYDLLPDGKTKNTGKHVYSFKQGNFSGILEIDHTYSPLISGHETRSKIHFEINNKSPEEEIQIYRSFIVPSFMHHIESHRPDIINFNDSVINSDDLVRRLGNSFESIPGKSISAKRKLDPKISRIFAHIKKRLNTKRG
jgi:hypothetical protein